MTVRWDLVPIALVAAWLLGYVARWLAPRVGLMDRPDGDLKPHAQPVPLLGGLAIVGGMLAGMAARGFGPTGPQEALARWGTVLALLLAFLLGLVDDRRGVPPRLRLAAEAALGALVAWALPAAALPGAILEFLVALLLFVAVLNAVNMVDGIDGLAASLAVVSACGIAMVGYGGRGLVVVLITMGAALGFLFHNWPPARLFLGDSGAYALGTALAVSILTHGRTPQGLLGGLTCLGLIAMDLGLAILRRGFGGAPLMGGDRMHFYDQLMRRGLGAKATLLWCLVLQAGFVIVGVGIDRIPLSKVSALVFALFWSGVAAVLALTGFVRSKETA